MNDEPTFFQALKGAPFLGGFILLCAVGMIVSAIALLFVAPWAAFIGLMVALAYYGFTSNR